MNDKKELRKYFRKLRDDLSEEVVLKKSLELFDIVKQSDFYRNSETIFCYISFDKEINTRAFLKECVVDNKNLCVPVVTGKHNMIASKILSLNNLMINNYGILEPIIVEPVEKENIDLIIVPALSYRLDGHRIGYGAGFYDNFLNGYKNASIGVVFKEFISDFNVSTNDKPVDKVFYI